MVHNNLHRVAIVDEKGNLTGVLTQSGLAEFISEEYAPQLDSDKTKVRDIPNLPGDVVSITGEEKAINAFKKMRDEVRTN
jgi:predicted transcriptional regulator